MTIPEGWKWLVLVLVIVLSALIAGWTWDEGIPWS